MTPFIRKIVIYLGHLGLGARTFVCNVEVILARLFLIFQFVIKSYMLYPLRLSNPIIE
jgi:hypothetical protein